MKLVWINGSFVRQESARIGVTDIGFNYGAGVYEVVNVYDGRPYRLDEHLARFDRSATEIELSLDIRPLSAVCRSLIEKNNEKNAVIYIQATYGDYGIRSHILPSTINPTLAAFTQSAPVYPARHFVEGVSLMSTPDERWGRCDIKCTSLIANLLVTNRAVRAGFDEAVFVRREDQTISECAASNIFAVKNGLLYTPPAGRRVLSGITREVIVELAKNSFSVREEFFTLRFLKDADEVFISSSTKEIMPVRSVDETTYGAPGAVTLALMQALVADVEEQTGIVHLKRELFSHSG